MSNRKERRRVKFKPFDALSDPPTGGPAAAATDEGAFAPSVVPSVSALRRHLLVLLDTLSYDYEYTAPSLMRSDYAPVFGTDSTGPGSLAEAHLRELAQAISADLVNAAADVAVAEATLDEYSSSALGAPPGRRVAHAGSAARTNEVEGRLLELRSEVRTAHTHLTVDLEAEAVAADTILEEVQGECGAVRSAAATLSDAGDYIAAHSALVARIEAIVPLLRTVLPRAGSLPRPWLRVVPDATPVARQKHGGGCAVGAAAARPGDPIAARIARVVFARRRTRGGPAAQAVALDDFDDGPDYAHALDRRADTLLARAERAATERFRC